MCKCFFDEAARVQNLKGFLQSIAELQISVAIVGAARPYEMTAVRSTYSVSMDIACDTQSREYVLNGLSDCEIDLLVHHLLKTRILHLPPGVDPALVGEAIKKRTDRKFLVLTIELTSGAKVQDVVRDEIERIRPKGERLLSLYRYVCLMASINSFVTVPMAEELINNRNVRLDVVNELPGLVILDGDNLLPRHKRIGEIATEIFFQDQDDARGDALCKILSIAFARREVEVIRSATGASRLLPKSQRIRVANHLIDELYRIGETDLIERVIEELQWAHESTELFLEFLTSNTPFLWAHLIFPNGPLLDWKRIEESFDLSFRSVSLDGAGGAVPSTEVSYDNCMRWAGVFELAAWNLRGETPFLVAITEKIYEVLKAAYPNRECDICLRTPNFYPNNGEKKRLCRCMNGS